jgi:O-antigen/teichoic acid export membrane protein
MWNQTRTLAGHVEKSNEEALLEFRGKISDISYQSSISFLGTICTLVVGYLFKVYLARALGAQLLGWNALGIGLYAICRLIGDLGLPYAAARYMAVYSSTQQRDRLRSFFWTAFSFSMLGASALCVIVIAGRGHLALHFFHDPPFSRYLPFYAILIPIGAANSFALQCLTGLKQVNRRTAITHFISFPFMILMTLVALKLGFSLWGYVSAQIGAEILGFGLAMWTILRNGYVIRSSPIALRSLHLQPEEWYFAMSMLAISSLEFMSSGADRLILGHLVEAKQIGIYAVASSVAALCPLVLQSINTVFGPTIANLYANEERELLLRLYQTLTKWVIAITFPLIFVLILFSRIIMGVFGPEFQAGSAVLAILSAGQLVNIGVGSVGTLLFMSGNQKRLIPIQVGVALFVLVANVTLIPILGILGAAIVASVGVALTNVWFLATIRKTMGLFPYTRSYFKLILPSALTIGSLWALNAKVLVTLPRVPVLVTVFVMANCLFFTTFLAFGLTGDDRIVLQVMRGRLQSLFLRAF